MTKDSIELALSTLEAEKANFSTEQLQRLVDLTKAVEDVRSDVTGKLEITEDREITPESMISTLKSRFELSENKELRKVLNFADVEKSLRATPEKLVSLQKLEETGGEPQVVGIDGDEFIFEDRCEESPIGRRNLNAYQAMAQADDFGADMQSPDAYMAMQKTGREYDKYSGSWLETSPQYLKALKEAYYGTLNIGYGSREADMTHKRNGWRASLRVKKV